MKRYTLVAAMTMATMLGGCAQHPERGNNSKPGNTKPDGDLSTRTNEPTTYQAGDKTGVRQMIELRVIDDEMRTKLGLNHAEDMLVTLTNDANNTQPTILYVSKDLDAEFMAAPDKFIHNKKLEKFIQILAVNGAPAPAESPAELMAEPVSVSSAKMQRLTTLALICKRRANGSDGWTWIPKPPCP